MPLTIRLCILSLFGPLLIAAQVCVAAAGPGSAAEEQARNLTAQARALDRGLGVAHDPEQAAELYCEAARLGHAPAQYHLGWMYANARGIERDKAAASALFGLAAKQGHPQAQNMLRLVGGTRGKLPLCMSGQIQGIGKLNTPERRRAVEIVQRLAPGYGVRPLLALAIIKAESDFDPRAVSPKNAQGLMQLIPETAARFKVADSFDPEQNIRGGLAYLRWLLAYYQGKVSLVAAGYNAGERAVDRYRGVPPYAETQAYVQRVMKIVKRDWHPYEADVTAPSPGFVTRLSARD